MPVDTKFLGREVSKLAKLSALKNGLPGALRAAPVAAIAVGGVISRMAGKGDENFVEAVLLGEEDVTRLGAPSMEAITQPISRNKISTSAPETPSTGVGGDANQKQ
jgi:hypothetical protein